MVRQLNNCLCFAFQDKAASPSRGHRHDERDSNDVRKKRRDEDGPLNLSKPRSEDRTASRHDQMRYDPSVRLTTINSGTLHDLIRKAHPGQNGNFSSHSSPPPNLGLSPSPLVSYQMHHPATSSPHLTSPVHHAITSMSPASSSSSNGSPMSKMMPQLGGAPSKGGFLPSGLNGLPQWAHSAMLSNFGLYGPPFPHFMPSNGAMPEHLNSLHQTLSEKPFPFSLYPNAGLERGHGAPSLSPFERTELPPSAAHSDSPPIETDKKVDLVMCQSELLENESSEWATTIQTKQL